MLNILEQKFDKIMPIAGDVSDRESLLAVVDVVKARHGYIDLLINNAGIARNLLPHPLPAPFDESPVALPPSPPASPNPSHPPSSSPSIQAFQNTLWDSGSPEDFAESFAVNVTAVYYTTVAFLDLLHQGNNRRRRLEFPMNHDSLMHPPYHTSQVLCVSSSGSFRLDSRVLSLSYTLAKCACTHLGKLLANLLTPWGIRSNVLAPGVWPTGTVSLWSLDGYIFTHSATQDMTTSPTPTFKLDPEVLAATVPLRRVGTQQVRYQFFSHSSVDYDEINYIPAGHGWHYPFPGESGWCLC